MFFLGGNISPPRRILLVYGAMRDKAVPEITEILFPHVAAVILTQPRQFRAATPETIRELAVHLNIPLFVEPSPENALQTALGKASPDDVIFVTGSLFLVGDLLRLGEHGSRPASAAGEPLPLASPRL